MRSLLDFGGNTHFVRCFSSSISRFATPRNNNQWVKSFALLNGQQIDIRSRHNIFPRQQRSTLDPFILKKCKPWPCLQSKNSSGIEIFLDNLKYKVIKSLRLHWICLLIFSFNVILISVLRNGFKTAFLLYHVNGAYLSYVLFRHTKSQAAQAPAVRWSSCAIKVNA